MPLIVVRGGAPVGGVREIEVEKGELVRLRVRSDPGESVHVHGYEIEEPLGPAGTVTLAFPARLDGIYEIELHAHDLGDVELAELVVTP